LHNNTTSTDLSSGNFAASTSGGVVTFTFPGYGSSLPNGNYSATLAAANVSDVAGNALASSGTSDFFFMNADGDRSGKVAIEDFNILAANFGKSSQTFGQGNYDYSSDGTITINDFNLLATYFGQSVDVNAPAAPASFIATNNPPASTTRSTQTIGMATNTKPTSLDPKDKNDLLSDVLL
jgi:hypothetical protein